MKNLFSVLFIVSMAYVLAINSSENKKRLIPPVNLKKLKEFRLEYKLKPYFKKFRKKDEKRSDSAFKE